MALPLSFRWPEEFVQRIDDERGDVSRSRFVQRAVEAALGSDPGGKAVSGGDGRSRRAEPAGQGSTPSSSVPARTVPGSSPGIAPSPAPVRPSSPAALREQMRREAK